MFVWVLVSAFIFAVGDDGCTYGGGQYGTWLMYLVALVLGVSLGCSRRSGLVKSK